MVRLTDTHCHLNLNQFDNDRDSVIARARDNGLQRILVPGLDLETSRTAVELAETNELVYAAVGLHPNSAQEWTREFETSIRELASHPKVVAIGEIGLDYYRDRAPRSLQRNLLHEQLKLAQDTGLPVVIHNRQATNDLLSVLAGWQTDLSRNNHPLAFRPGVFHAYSGDFHQALSAIDSMFMIGVAGPVTFQHAKAYQEVIQQLPLESVLIETDAPFLTPHPYRGRRNEPAYVQQVALKIAELHEKEPSDIAQMTAENANRLFTWGDPD